MGFILKKNIIMEAEYLINTNKTLRKAAEDLKISKTTLHRHLSILLPKINTDLYLMVKKLFLEHNKVKHINGGKATKLKYSKR